MFADCKRLYVLLQHVRTYCAACVGVLHFSVRPSWAQVLATVQRANLLSAWTTWVDTTARGQNLRQLASKAATKLYTSTTAKVILHS